MTKPLLLLDLDRTLLNTDLFFEAMWRLAARVYGVDAGKEMERAHRYFTYYDDSYDYRFFDHLQEAVSSTRQTASPEKFSVAARNEYANAFLYPDVTDDIVRSIDEIVTFGGAEYQRLKLFVSPRLQNIPHRITLKHKSDLIAETYGRQPVILIDDKPIGNTMRPPARFIQIIRDQSGEELPASAIRSLSELPSALYRLD